jgi:hypothetical protein
MSSLTSEALPTSGSLNLMVPKLDKEAANWSIWRDRMEMAFESQGLWDVMTGLENCQAEPASPLANAPSTELASLLTIHASTLKLIKEWRKSNVTAQLLLLNSMTDNHAGRISKKKTAKEQWDMLVAKLEPSTDLIRVDKRRALGEIRCAAGGDIRAHFNCFLQCHRELVAAGGTIDNKDLTQLVILSIPNEEYQTHIQLVMTTACLMNKSLTLSQLISEITSEFNSWKILARAADDTQKLTEALFASTPQPSNGNCASNISCWDCGENHKWADCPHAGGVRNNQQPQANSWRGHVTVVGLQTQI